MCARQTYLRVFPPAFLHACMPSCCLRVCYCTCRLPKIAHCVFVFCFCFVFICFILFLFFYFYYLFYFILYVRAPSVPARVLACVPACLYAQLLPVCLLLHLPFVKDRALYVCFLFYFLFYFFVFVFCFIFFILCYLFYFICSRAKRTCAFSPAFLHACMLDCCPPIYYCTCCLSKSAHCVLLFINFHFVIIFFVCFFYDFILFYLRAFQAYLRV